jgi:hypothetical protein
VYEESFRHIYDSNQIVAQPNNDSLTAPKEQSELLFAELALKIEQVIDARTSVDNLVTTVQNADSPPAFRNMLCVICAEGARRRRSDDAAIEIMRSCTNAALSQLFSNWRNRCLKNRRARVELAGG